MALKRGLVTGDHLIQRVAHQEHIYAAVFQQSREYGVIAGEHDDAFACCFHRQQVGDRERPRVSVHRASIPPALGAKSRGWTARDEE